MFAGLRAVFVMLNTRAIGYAGAGLATFNIISGARMLSDEGWLLAMLGNVLGRQPVNWYAYAQLAGVLIGITLGCAMAYVGRPATIPPAR
jgi:hypothetical protein